MTLRKIFHFALFNAGKFSNFQTNGIPAVFLKRHSINAIFKLIRARKWAKKPSTLTQLMTPFTTMGILGFMKKKDVIEDSKSTSQEILLAKADALFDQSKYKEIYELLNNYRDNKNVEILWRLCRALYNMSKSASEVEAKKMIYEGYDLISTALSIDDNHWAVHKWMAVFLDTKSSHEGMKSRITELLTVKKHMERASELNPKDATTLYMLGNWCFKIADLAWYQRKIASAVFAKPPESSFEEALKYFEAAEKIEPNFYSHNLLMLGKTYAKLNKPEDAIKFFKMAAEYDARNDDDQEAKKDAVKNLNQLGFKTQ